MASGNDDIKNKLGAEYDLYSSLKDNFQGFDKEGNAVFKDEAGDVTSFNKTDFGKMNDQLKNDFGQKSYEDTFNKNQFDDLAKQGNKFQGFAGDNAIFRNEKGDLENFGSQGGFASFLKKQQPNAAFDIAKQGQSQRSSAGYSAGADFLSNKEVVKQKTGSGFTGYNPLASIQNLGGNISNPQPEFKTSVNPNIAKANTPGGTFQSFKAKQPQKPTALSQEPETQYEPEEPQQKAPSLGAMAKQMAMTKAKTAANQFIGQKKDQAQNMATGALANATGLSTQMITNPQDAARQAAINKAAGVTGLDANLLQGNVAGNIQNLAEDKAKAAGMNYLKANDPTGMAQYAGLINGDIVDNTKQFAIDKAKTAGADFLKQNDPTGGALSGAMQYADLLKGDVVKNAKNLAIDKAKTAGMDFLKQNDPTGGALSQYAQYAKLLDGDVVKNAKDLAVQKAKEEAKKRATQEATKQLAAAGFKNLGTGEIGAALDAGKAAKNILSGGGSTEEKGRAAAQAAARATAAYLTGGLATEQNMELSHALTNKGFAVADKNVGSDLKPAVDVARNYADVGQTLSKGAVKLGLDAVGNTGAAQGRALSDAGKAVKAITSGNIEDGLKGLGKGATNLALQTFLKNPATIAKGIGNLGKESVAKAASAAKSAASAVANSVKKLFKKWCFAPDTAILMADGKYKLIRNIKIGEEVMLGGAVTSIGTAISDNMYLYDGVQVSGGHSLFENGKWIRTEDSKYSVKLDTGETLVYPIDTMNHLIVTKGQIWSDLTEMDDIEGKTHAQTIDELNAQTEVNRNLTLFLKLYFKSK